MAVAHKLDVQLLDFFQRIHHIRALKGPDDAVEIIFVGRGEISLNQIVEHTAVGIVAAETVTGEQRLGFGNIGVHAVRPVQKRHAEEMQRHAAKVYRILFRHGAAGKLVVHNLLQKVQRRGAAQHSGVWRQRQQFFQAAAVVGFGVVHHNVIDAGRVAHFAHICQKFVEKFQLAGFKKGGFFAALYKICVVAGAPVGMHDDVEHAQVRVLRAHIPDVFFCQKRAHSAQPSFVEKVSIAIRNQLYTKIFLLARRFAKKRRGKAPYG